MKDYKELLFEASNSWEKKRGLVTAIIAVIGIYFLFIKGIIKEGVPNIDFKLLNIYVPIILLLLILIIWLITTNRISLPKSGDLSISLFLFVDEEEAEQKIKKIAKNTLKDLRNNFPRIRIDLKPINFIKSKSELKTYLSKNSGSCDTAVFANVDSGKIKDAQGNIDDCLEINDITFSGKFNVNSKFKIFLTTVSISKDLNIRNINKNWSYLENNSLKDKVKIKKNFKDSILFFAGIYLIYQMKPNEALDILKTLHSPEDSKARVSVKEKKIIASERFISAARLNEILINLFVTSSSHLYNNNEVQKAYDALKECENIFGKNPISFHHYISLARFSYELGNLDEAKSYTAKAKEIRPTAPQIYLNEGFFAILDGNENELYKNYKELSKVYKHRDIINYTEVISFLETVKRKKSDNKILVEFAIGSLNLFFSDYALGRKILVSIHSDELNSEYPLIYKLINQFLTKGEIKSPYYRKYQKAKKKKRK